MTDISEGFARTAGKHFVSLSCVQQLTSGDTKLLLFSGFLIEVLDQWMYVTAGHILRDIGKAMKSGSTFDVWRLGDQTAGNRFKNTAIPYAFDLDDWLVVENEELGLDYAIAPVPWLNRLALEANDVQPIGKSAWGDHVSEFDHWALLGIASETVKYDGVSEISAKFSLTPLEPAQEPEGAGARAENQFYAQFSHGAEVRIDDADGLSGSPVFALKKIDGGWKYNVIGVQSGWYPETRVLVICPIASFAFEMEKIVQDALDGRNESGE